MNRMQTRVSKFHSTFGAPVADSPTLIPLERADLRARLIQEELDEYIAAVRPQKPGGWWARFIRWIKREPQHTEGDLVEAADAIVDMLVVVFGTAVEHGIDAQPLFEHIMDSNMSKADADGNPIISDGTDGFPKGKILKGPNYFKPNLKPLLEAQGWTTNEENR